jgi:Zn-dependent peptidase ImmA (M78 family)
MALVPLPRPVLAARRLAIQHKLGLPTDVLQLARRHRIEVYFAPLDSASGMLVPHGNRYEIIVNSETRSPNRIRFTIAHELGHFFLHAQDRRPYRESTYRGETEREANAFAAELLMPAQAMRSLLMRYHSTQAAADYCGVSYQAMTYRLQELGL